MVKIIVQFNSVKLENILIDKLQVNMNSVKMVTVALAPTVKIGPHNMITSGMYSIVY